MRSLGLILRSENGSTVDKLESIPGIQFVVSPLLDYKLY
jgi:hypothetical protein